VWSFAPPAEELFDDSVVIESASSTPGLHPTEDEGEEPSDRSRPGAPLTEPPPTISLADDGDQAMPDAPVE
jgi:F-box and WD-40 domain protein CDC4